MVGLQPVAWHEPRRVGVEAADVDELLLGRPLDEAEGRALGQRHQQLDELGVAPVLRAADVEDLAVHRVAGPGQQEGRAGVVDVHEVAHLRTVAEYLDLAAVEGQAHEPADEALAVVADQLPRAVDVGQTQRAGAHPEDVVVEQMVVLAGDLVDAVDVGGADEMRLGDRQRLGAAIDLPGAGVDHLGAGVVVAAGLEQRQLGPAVHLEVGVRVAHAVDVTDLAGEVEDHVLAAHQIVHGAGLAHVGDVEPHAILHRLDVEQVAARIRDERVDEQHLRAEVGEADGQVAADEAEPAGDHHAAPAVEVGAHVSVAPAPAGPRRARRRARAGVRGG